MTPVDDLAHFADVPLDLEAELDRCVLKVREILELEEGSVISTQRSAGENIDVYIGEALIGYGEIVVIENSMGVRLTDFHKD
jgi:flagellar motor switch protein FliN